jgi:nicotinamidase-related amidase
VKTPAPVAPDPVYHALQQTRHAHATPGVHNAADAAAGFAQLDFASTARPVGTEGIAENGDQLAALCRTHSINHLIYVGFAINWCLLMSPGGMVDMKRHGCICSTIAEAVTAVENRETARDEREKQQALWRVAVEFGFVFHLSDFIGALPPSTS